MKLARLSDVRLHAVLRKLSELPLPLRVAFKLKGVTVKVDEELRKFESVRQGALEKYGKKDVDGKLVIKPNGDVEFEPDQLQQFAKELNELGQVEVDIPTMKLEELDECSLSVDELTLLDAVVVE